MIPILERLKGASGSVFDKAKEQASNIQHNVAVVIARAPVARAVASKVGVVGVSTQEYEPTGIIDAIQQRPGVQKLRSVIPEIKLPELPKFGKDRVEEYTYDMPPTGRSEQAYAEESKAI